MNDSELQVLIQHLAAASERSAARSVSKLRASDDPAVLIAAALFDPELDTTLARARQVARTTRDRQLVAISAAHLAGQRDRVDALIREHLVDHPDSPIVAWIAANGALGGGVGRAETGSTASATSDPASTRSRGAHHED